MKADYLKLTVLGAAGEPLSDARVFWSDERSSFLEYHADEDGRILAGPLAARHIGEVWVEGSGLARRRLTLFAAASQGVKDLGKITLTPGPRIRATFLRSDGALVLSGKAQIEMMFHTLCHTVRRDGPLLAVEVVNGELVSPPLAPGTAFLTFTTTGCSPYHKDITVTADFDNDIDLGTIKLENEQPRRGRVLDESGQPIVGATISLQRLSAKAVSSEDDGSFLIHGLGSESEMIGIEAEGYSSQIAQVEGDGSDLEITMLAVRKIRGLVVDAESGAPLPIKELELHRLIRIGDQTRLRAG